MLNFEDSKNLGHQEPKCGSTVYTILTCAGHQVEFKLKSVAFGFGNETILGDEENVSNFEKLSYGCKYSLFASKILKVI